MKKLMMLALLMTPVLAQAAVSTRHGMVNGMPYFEASETVTGQGKVIAVDHEKRDLTVVTKKDTVIVTCGPEVKNFEQIAHGDMVKTRYTETVTIQVQPGGTPGSSSEKRESGASPGESPAGTVSQKTHFSATITAIDKASGTVTLKDEKGESFTLTPRDVHNLDKVKVGQLAHFTFEQVAAVWVEKVKPTKSSKTAKSSSAKK